MPKFKKEFKKDKRQSGGKDFGRKSFGDRSFSSRDSGGRDRGRERTMMHEAVCDECGRKCEVPFRPTGDKPIYCRDCFGDRGGREERNSFGGRERSFGNKERQMYSATCSGCGGRCEVPFRPTGDKPVYCEKCFDKNKGGSSMGGGDVQLKKQIDILNTKVDKILEILSMSGIADVDDEMDSEIDWDIIEDDTIADEIKEEMLNAKPAGEKKPKEEKKKPAAKKSKTEKVENKVEKKKPATKKAPAKKKK